MSSWQILAGQFLTRIVGEIGGELSCSLSEESGGGRRVGMGPAGAQGLVPGHTDWATLWKVDRTSINLILNI